VDYKKSRMNLFDALGLVRAVNDDHMLSEFFRKVFGCLGLASTSGAHSDVALASPDCFCVAEEKFL